jgi:hypothetical protein
MQNDEPNNLDQPVTKADLAATRGEFKELFTVHKAEMEQLLTDQADVILEAVDVKLDKKFGEVMKGIDAVMKEVQAHREEDVAGAAQLRRHDDQLQDHAKRINALELQPQQ